MGTVYRASSEAFAGFMRALVSGDTPVVGPIAQGDDFVFGPIRRAEELRLDAPSTLYPPKKYFLPPKETLLKYRVVGKKIHHTAVYPTGSQIIVGVHPCDLMGIEAVDRTYLNKDRRYTMRRRNTTVVAMDYMVPPPNSFCLSVGAHTLHPVDGRVSLLLTKVGDDFLIEVGTKQGERLLKRFAPVLPCATQADLCERETVRDRVAMSYPRALPVPLGDLPQLLHNAADHPHWKKMAKQCVGCNACTAVCGSCACTTRTEIPCLDGTGASVRQCATCLAVDFARVAGHNFRPELFSRQWHRAEHKLTCHQQNGEVVIDCTGCGRCDTTCKFHIASPVDILNAIVQA